MRGVEKTGSFKTMSVIFIICSSLLLIEHVWSFSFISPKRASISAVRASDAVEAKAWGGARLNVGLGMSSEEYEEEVEEEEEDFLRRELEHLQDLEGMLEELEGDEIMDMDFDLEDDYDIDDFDDMDDDTLLELLGLNGEDEDVSEVIISEEELLTDLNEAVEKAVEGSSTRKPTPLEQALLQGVVPEGAGVGSNCLPGDCSFDPLNLATKDYFKNTQHFLLNLLPANDADTEAPVTATRPAALILRDYREAEIRHGRLAMLAVVFWPLQQMLDRLLIPVQSHDTTIIYGGTTLPYLSLLMTLIMLLLGYLDIYANVIRSQDTGDAYLPGECFWDPLAVLQGAPDTMKRNMQERELMNGRAAMIAFAAYVFEEATTHKPLITIPGNEYLFSPAYTVPAIQVWLDSVFQSPSPALTLPDLGPVDFVETLKEVLEEEEQLNQLLENQIMTDDTLSSSSSAAAQTVSDVAEQVTAVITQHFFHGVI
mmetsp:Transcript_10702/g.14355  ORF Transcript_10702/g.14355 Transcript_10702/m.14355 type:complete len:483 (+) Transcript_10702:70-1518(+)